ncbi:DUF721 domain-containing protein [Ectothiorhodospiraceae bacterium WFHF3C12]|nr:DUF721 domain-containing protein [Ectothiorhodospiraceae bacterium WFHF3C12]
MSGRDSKYPKRLGTLLGQTGLGRVSRHARTLQSLEERLWPVLAPLVDGDWRLARLDQEKLVLVVESPAFASAVRYRQRQILSEIRRVTGSKPRRLQVKIAPTRARPRPVPRRRLSPEAAAHIEEAARGADSPALREALLRLAGRSRSGEE